MFLFVVIIWFAMAYAKFFDRVYRLPPCRREKRVCITDEANRMRIYLHREKKKNFSRLKIVVG